MLNDVRYALRNLRRAPGFTMVIVLTLALGIGANTAIFSVVHALIFNPLPYPDPDRLMLVTFDTEQPEGFQTWPYPTYAAFSAEQKVFQSTAAFATLQITIRPEAQAERVEGEIVTASYFPLFGVTAARGRVFLPEEDRVPGEAAVIVLGDRLWRGQFHADPNVIGRTITIKDRPYEIIGVLPPSFRGQSGTAEFWVPAMMGDHVMYKGAISGAFSWWIRVVARLHPDVTLEQVRAALPAMAARVGELAPARARAALNRNGEQQFRLVPFRLTKVNPDVSRSFVILLVAVGFVLLIACANTANLLLGRAIARQKEFAVRLALGASPLVVMRQLAVESMLLALAAGIVGVGVAFLALDWLTTARPWTPDGFWSQYARTFDYFTFALDRRALAFNFAVAAGVGAVFGAAPAWQASRSDLTDALKHGSGGSASGFSRGRSFGARSALVVTEIAFSLVLLAAAGLMIKSFARVSSTDLGFVPDEVLTMSATVTGQRPASFYQDLVSRIQSLPGVQQAALSQGRPLAGGGYSGPIAFEAVDGSRSRTDAMLNVVTTGFFEVYRMRMIQGRGFAAGDSQTGERVAVVSRALAARAWPGADPIGRKVHSDLYGRQEAVGWARVVGVVDDVAYGPLEDPPTPVLFLSASQSPRSAASMPMAPRMIAIRSSVDPAATVAAVRREAAALDGSIAIYDASTMADRTARATSRYRYTTLMMTALAGVALLLAAVGTYGVMAYAVTARTREIGIRMALGARHGDVVRLLMGDGLKMAGAGLVAGLAGAYMSTQLLTVLLYNVSPGDPLVLAAVAAVMAGVAGLASILPARRVLKVDPVIALRIE